MTFSNRTNFLVEVNLKLTTRILRGVLDKGDAYTCFRKGKRADREWDLKIRLRLAGQRELLQAAEYLHNLSCSSDFTRFGG